MDAPVNHNHLSHTALVPYFREVLGMFRQQPEDYTSFIEHFTEDIAEFEALVNASFVSEQDRAIDRLDRDRYAAFEAVADRIDDIMNAQVEDPGMVLYRLGLDEEKARLQIPEYIACNALLAPHPKDPSRGVCYCERHTRGHQWPPEEADRLIARLRDPSLRPQAEIAGLAGRVDALVKADGLLRRAFSEPGATITPERLGEIRKKRDMLVNCLGIMYYRIPALDKDLLKKPKRIPAHEAFGAQLLQIREMRDLEEFSYNDFSYAAVATIAKKVRDQVLGSGLVGDRIRDDFQKELARYEALLADFSSDPKWPDLDAVESARLRDMERLLLSVTAHFGCLGADCEEIWARHVASEEYRATNALFEELDLPWFEIPDIFSRGQETRPELHLEILETWDNPVNRQRLDILECLALFDECRGHEAHSDLIIESMTDNGPAEREKLRESRFQLCLLLKIAEGQLKGIWKSPG
jgi:hypothetical protein